MTDNNDISCDLDLRGQVCPMAFVRVRLFTDTKRSGSRFTILYENTSANEPLTRSIEGIGHRVISEKTIRPKTTEEDVPLKTIVIEIAGAKTSA